MERLTHISNDRYVVSRNTCGTNERGDMCGEAIDRLAAYERIDLSPDDIEQCLAHRLELMAALKCVKGIESENEPLSLAELEQLAQQTWGTLAVWMVEARHDEPVPGLIRMQHEDNTDRMRLYILLLPDQGCGYQSLALRSVERALAQGAKFYRQKP